MDPAGALRPSDINALLEPEVLTRPGLTHAQRYVGTTHDVVESSATPARG
jgi:hypothetical protein